MDTMLYGGIEKSLLPLVGALNPDETDVTVLLDKAKGPFLSHLPEWVKTVEIPYDELTGLEKQLGRKRLLTSLFRRGKLLKALRLYRVQRREMRKTGDALCIERTRRFYRHILPCKELETVYDLAISYAGTAQLILVSDYVKARRKTAFFHTQLATAREDVCCYRSFLGNFDKLYAVSAELTENLKKVLPEFEDRICFFPHILNKEAMQEQSEEFAAVWPGSGLKILSVGRFERQKGFDMIPEIVSRLATEGVDFQWVIVGDGYTRGEIVSQIEKYGVCDRVFVVGAMPNPYPYFASCDIYVQPSRYEGYCLAVAEARAFARPIVATDFNGASEQLEGGRCGEITECTVEAVYDAVKRLSADSSLRKEFSRRLAAQPITDARGVELIKNDLETAIRSVSPRFSIIVPVYNVGPYISMTLRSLQIQTFADFEVIAIDDGSTDGSGDVIDEYAASDSRIRVIRQKNSGVSAARNAGLENARGEWVMFVDGDDALRYDALQLLSDCILRHPSADMIGFGYDKTDAVTPDLIAGSAGINPYSETECNCRESVGFGALDRYMACMGAYKRKMLRGLRFEHLRNGEDVLFCNCAAFLTACFVATNARIYLYLQRGASARSNEWSERRCRDYATANERITDNIRGCRRPVDRMWLRRWTGKLLLCEPLLHKSDKKTRSTFLWRHRALLKSVAGLPQLSTPLRLWVRIATAIDSESYFRFTAMLPMRLYSKSRR